MKRKNLYSNKNLENKKFYSNTITLGDTMERINEDHLYFLDRDQHGGISDEEACLNSEPLLSFKSTGKDQDATISELIESIAALGTVPIVKDKYKHFSLDLTFRDMNVDFVDDIDLEWDWDIFENVVLIDGFSLIQHMDHIRDCEKEEEESGPSWKRHLNSVGFPY